MDTNEHKGFVNEKEQHNGHEDHQGAQRFFRYLLDFERERTAVDLTYARK